MKTSSILAAAKRGAEPYQQVSAMERAAGYDRARLADALWTGFRGRSFDVLQSHAFWGPMAEAPSSYRAEDVEALLTALAASAARRDWVGALDGWDPAFDAMIDAYPQALERLAQADLPEPVAGGVTLARARRGLIPPEQVPDRLLRRAARAAARGWGVSDPSGVGLERVWPADRFGAAVIAAALEDPSRIVQISEVLRHGATASPLQLLQLVLARGGEAQLIPWLPKILDGAAEVEHEALAAAGRALKRASYEQQALPNAAVLLVLDRLASARGETLDPRFDPMLPEALQRHGDAPELTQRMRALLGRLPEARRASAVLLLDRYPAWPYVDLAPTPGVLAVCAQAIGRLGRATSLELAHTAAFAALGAAGARAILAALERPDPEREQSHLMLELLAEAPLPEAIPALVAATGDGREAVRQAARTALCRFTQAGLEGPVLDALEAALSARRRGSRVGAALTLAALPRSPALTALAERARAASREQEVCSALSTLVDPPVAPALAAWIALAPRKLTPACRGLARALEDWSEGWRGQLDLPPEDLLAGTVLWLEGHLASATSFYRWDRVLGVLDRLKGTPLLAVAPWALGSVLGDCGRERVSESYMAQLGAAFGEAAVAPVLRALSPPPQHRAALYDWLLIQHPETLPEAVLDAFLKALSDPSAAVRRLAVRAVSRAPAALPRLSAMVSTGKVSEAILAALRGSPPGPGPSGAPSDAAREALAAATAPERAEIALPTFGFDRRGQQTLPWGQRSLRLELSWTGEVSLYDETGTVLARMPRARRGEDPAEIQATRARISALRRAVKAAARAQNDRLKEAMITGRGWTPSRFRALFLEHPLQYQSARRLLFRGRAADGRETLYFVTEEGEPTGLDLNSINIEKFELIQIVHPAELEPALREAWTALFAEAALYQPFGQLQRRIATFSPADDPLAALLGRALTQHPQDLVASLRARGWRPVPARPAGRATEARRDFGGGWRAQVRATPAGDAATLDVILTLNGAPMAASAAPPRLYSEVVRDLRVALAG